MIIFDTNVVSDLMSGGSDPVHRWLSTIAGPDVHTTVITRSEIRYGVLMAWREAMARPISGPGAQIASIAHTRRAAVATRNVRDFAGCSITVIDPFASTL